MADFVLTRPYFLLLLLLPLLMKFIRFSGRYRHQTFVKQEIIDYFADERVRKKKKLRVLFLIPWIIGCIALSGPTLVDREHAEYRSGETWVWAIDLSNSMLSDDVKPSRYLHARYTLTKLLGKTPSDIKIGIVVFAGSAYVLVPPTDDHQAIRNYLKDLDPSVMPVQGSNLASALEVSNKVLDGICGNVLFVTDDVKDSDTADYMAALINNSCNRYFMDIVGTVYGSPMKKRNGELVKTPDGRVALSSTNFSNISALSKAAGMLVFHQDSEADIASVYRHSVKEQGAGAKNYFRTADIGYYLIFPLLILAVFFKRGIILSVGIALAALQLVLAPAPAFAGNSEGMKYFEEGKFDLAAREFTDEFWIGNSYYKEQRYYQAVEHYEKAGNSVEVLYNLANAYAKTGDLDNAMMLYQQVIEQNPPFRLDAEYNLDLVKDAIEADRKRDSQRKSGSADAGITSEEGVMTSDLTSCDKNGECVPAERSPFVRNRLELLRKRSGITTGPAEKW